MTVTELIEELQACNGEHVAVNSDGDEIDSIEEDGDEVVLFTEADDDEAESEAIDAEATPE